VGRLLLAAAIVLSLATIASWWPLPWINLDGDRMLEASQVFLRGDDPYGIPGYLYSPLAPILTAPLALVPYGLALLLLVKVELVAGYAWVRFGPLLAVAVLLSPPVFSDLVLGNVNLLLVAAAAWMIAKGGIGPGVVSGILFAAFPKPMLLPLLLWVFVFRRRSALGWLIASLVATAVAVAVVGPGRYAEFVALLLRGGDVGSSFVGSAGLSSFSPVAGFVVGVVAAGIFVWSMRSRDWTTSLVAAAAAGMLAGTYQTLNSAELLLGVLPWYAALHPRRAPLVLAAVFGAVVSLPLAAIATLAVALVPRSRAEPAIDRLRAWLPSRKGPATAS
jgi:hypothetical protein